MSKRKTPAVRSLFTWDQAQAPRELSKGGHLIANEGFEIVSGKKKGCQAQLPAKLAPLTRADHLFHPIQPLVARVFGETCRRVEASPDDPLNRIPELESRRHARPGEPPFASLAKTARMRTVPAFHCPSTSDASAEQT